MTLRLAAFAALLLAGPLDVARGEQDDPAARLQTLPDFKVELVMKADAKVHGSWINLAKDHKGRLLLAGQRNQPVTRVTLQDGKVGKEEDLQLPISEIMGMLWAFDSLYVNGGGRDDRGRNVYGLWRCRYDAATDRYGKIELLREWQGGPGEHGAHGIVAGQDGKLYIVNGNFVNVPNDLLPSSPHRNYADDRILPRAEDGNGFGAGRKPPGGYVVRLDPDGRNAELFASGQRNTYDIAMNADGEIFGFDSDMEWDWGTPWYRPVRVFHAVSAADHGFREGTAKWPSYYPDSLPPTVDVGIGSPTGVVFGAGARFPAKYQKALYILDWSYGRLIAVHLKPHGASYTATIEDFVAPRSMRGAGPKTPLNLTDAVVGDDGAMYFTVGGRNTAAALYRVTYAGSASTAPAELKDAEGADARARRRALEAHHGKADPAGLEAAKGALGDPDRFLRYAARIALERQPVESWKGAILAETRPQAALTGLLALARVGGAEAQADVLKALARFPADPLDEALLLEKLRVIQVSVARHGKSEAAAALAAELDPLYPSKSDALNVELCQVLLALEAPRAVEKTVDLLGRAASQEEQIGYLLHLRTATKGWTPELRRAYFGWWTRDRSKAVHAPGVVKWFEDSGRGYGDGASLPKFLGNMHTQSRSTLSAEETAALSDVLAAYTPPSNAPRRPAAKARTKVVREWTMPDFATALEEVGRNRNYESGKEAYEAAQCNLCHKFGAEGGAVGSDLTAVSSRFRRRDILESMIEPSKVISEQYQNMRVRLKNGDVIDGRILEENGERLVIQPNPLKPEKVTVKAADIDRRAPSTVSPMPPALLNVLTRAEVLDLLAYLESGGRRDHPAFGGAKASADVTERVAAAVKGTRLSIEASNALFGDPAPGQVKRLRVDYLEGEEPKAKVVAENETLQIAVPEGKKLVVKRAVYGVFP